MTPEQWNRVRDLFHRALDLPPNDRAAFLTSECPDTELRAEVESLLLGAETHLFDVPALEGVRQAMSEAIPAGGLVTEDGVTTAPLVGGTDAAVIDRYRLLQRIGEGGMGEVWLADQREPVRRRVALKLVLAGMNTREVIARFESERQALALMDHPAIAKVFDAGSTPQGRPYFVMEYVAGLPITTYCDQHRFSTRERLELFIRVCEGVQHAHQKAIIHRDLKPSNILVSEVDGRAMPKIIDFGVAKALTQRLTAETLFTRVGALVGTPEYMSPEQALSSGEDIDTRTDVYSLGIILYELLAGVPPLELRKIAFDEFLRRLREDEPPKPSTRIRTQEPATSSELARKRQSEPVTLARLMRGDLDSIALKALEKDRSRRYGSPSDFGADIERYLRNEAVQAVPPSLGYRARKFCRRNRGALITVCAFALVLMVAAGVSIRQSIRANREAAVAEAVKDFLQNDVLAQASAATQSGASVKPDPDLKVRTALDRAAVRMAGKFTRQPEVEASVRDTIGQTYTDLGLYPEARSQFERALALWRQVLDQNDPKTLRTMSQLGRLANLQGRYPEAEALLKEALDGQRRLLGPGHRDTLYSMNYLAAVYDSEGKYPEVESLQTQILDISRRVLGLEHPDTLEYMRSLAWVYLRERKHAQAETVYRQALETVRRILGPEHPLALSITGELATVYLREEKHAEAEALFNEDLEIMRRVLGPEHPNTLAAMNNLGLVYKEQAKYAQAEAVFRQLLDLDSRVVGAEHPSTLLAMTNLGYVYIGAGKYAEAEEVLTRTEAIHRRLLGPEHPNTLLSMHHLANAYAARGKYAAADALFNQALEIQRRISGRESGDTLYTLSVTAFVYQRQGQYALAEKYLAEDLAGLRHTAGPEEYIMATLADLALVYVSEKKFAQGEPLARQAVDFFHKNQPQSWQTHRSESILGATLAGQKKYDEAERLLLEGHRGMLSLKDRTAAPEWYYLDRAREWLVQLYQAWGKPEKAAEWRTKG